MHLLPIILLSARNWYVLCFLYRLDWIRITHTILQFPQTGIEHQSEQGAVSILKVQLTKLWSKIIQRGRELVAAKLVSIAKTKLLLKHATKDIMSIADILHLIECDDFPTSEENKDKYLGDLHFLLYGCFKNNNDAWMKEVETKIMVELSIKYIPFKKTGDKVWFSKGFVYELAKSKMTIWQESLRKASLNARGIAVMGRNRHQRTQGGQVVEIADEHATKKWMVFKATDGRPGSEGYVITAKRESAESPVEFDEN